MRNASFIYSTSFFITSNPKALLEVAKYASENNVPFGYNFSAVFLLMFELDNVLATLEHADYLFANEDEAAAFGKARGMEGASLQDIAKDIARFKKSNSKPRTAIVTNGAKPVIVARSLPGSDEVELKEYPVIALP